MQTLSMHSDRSNSQNFPSPLSWRDDLVHQIQVIGEKDPSKARDLHRRVLFCNWSRFELYKLSQEGLDVSRVSYNPGLPGGMLEAAELLFKLTAGIIKIVVEGNKKEMEVQKDGRHVPAQMTFKEYGVVQGLHEGKRILSSGERSFGSAGMKRFHLIATGAGKFISEDIRYEGEFLNGVFHDLTGNAQLITEEMRFKGVFRKGYKDGLGKIEKYEPELDGYYLYFEGMFKNDQPYNGTYYKPSGEPLIKCIKGTLEAANSSPGALDSLTPQERERAKTCEITDQQFSPSTLDDALPALPQEAYLQSRSSVSAISPAPDEDSEPVEESIIEIELASASDRSSSQSPSLPKCPESAQKSASTYQADLLPEEASPLITKKLKNPAWEPSLDESIEILTSCINLGLDRAEKIAGKEALIVIGNTGAGKSSFVNFLAGCTMELKKYKELGIKGTGKAVFVKPEADGGALNEVMPIGHSKRSKTFMPQIRKDPVEDITYCDCPGFLDNRGAEINIANAVNVKNAMSLAKGVKVIVLINYHSLKAERARGLTEMLTICSNLFGSTENIEKYKDSLLLGISNASFDTDLEEIKEWILEDTPEIMHTLSDRLFLFDPLDRSIDGGWTRSECLQAIKDLPPIKDPQSIFKTVLTDADENKLASIGEEMKSEIEKALSRNTYAKASARLDQLSSLSVIDHVAIERLLDQAFYLVTVHFRALVDAFYKSCHFDDFKEASNILNRLQKGPDIFGDRLESEIDMETFHAYYSESEKYYNERLAKEKEQQEYFDTIQSEINIFSKAITGEEGGDEGFLQFTKGRIQKAIGFLDDQEKELQLEVKRQNENFQKLAEETQSRIQEIEDSFTNLEETLTKELQQRLDQKQEEIRLAIELKQQSLNLTLQREKSDLETAYKAKLQHSIAEKQTLIDSHKRELALREEQNSSRQKSLEEKLASIESQKAEQTEVLQNISPPQIAFGKAKWEKYFGDVGVQPPLPRGINKVLKSPCPYWQGKKVEDTHLLVLIPKTVDGKAFTFNLLAELIQHPKGGGHATKFNNVWDKLQSQLGNQEVESSYWALVSKDVIPDSRDKSYADQCKLVQPSYRVVRLLELATSILMHHIRTGKRLYPDNPDTWGRCQENIDGYHLAVGRFGSVGLGAFNKGHINGYDYDCIGLGVFRELS